MPPLQNSAQMGFAYIPESVWGTTPSGALSELRVVSDSLEFKRDPLESQEIKSHRQSANIILGAHQVAGSLNCEFGDYLDDWLEAALFGEFASNVLKLGQSLKQFTLERRLAGVGWNMRYTGVRPNGFKLSLEPNAIAQIEFPVLGRTMTVAPDALNGPSAWLVNLLAGYAAGLATIAIDGGATAPSAGDQFVIYQAGSTTAQRSEQIYTVTGYDSPDLTFTPPLDVAISDNDILHFAKPATPINDNDPFNSFSGVVSEGGSPIAIATKIELTVDQGQTPPPVIGAFYPPALIAGKVTVSGSLSLYVQNMALFTKFLNETYSQLEFALTNGSATYTFLVTKIKYAGGKATKEAGGGPVVMDMPFVGVYDGDTENTTVKVTKS
jgi:Phage tail tube protein